MGNKAVKKKEPPCGHLEEYLKSSYEDRLNWLEEANRFVDKVLISSTDKKKKRRASCAPENRKRATSD